MSISAGSKDQEKKILRLHKSLAKMGMQDYAKRQISQLSGGQKQRVFIARAIAQNAEIYFMDEPLAGVDKNTEKVIIEFLKDSQKQGKTSIVIHHDLNTLADYFDHLIILNKRILAQGKMSETLTQANLDAADMGGGFKINA